MRPLRRYHDLEAFTFGFLGRGRAFAQSNDKVLGARVTQVQRVCVALRTVAQDGHFLVFDQVNVAIAIVVNAHVGAPFVVCLAGTIPVPTGKARCALNEKSSSIVIVIR
jgi:hypothetical protein